MSLTVEQFMHWQVRYTRYPPVTTKYTMLPACTHDGTEPSVLHVMYVHDHARQREVFSRYCTKRSNSYHSDVDVARICSTHDERALLGST